MARRRRIDVAGVPQHVIQRGVNRSACFCDEFDHRFYLETLREIVEEHDCAVHAYVMMTNHVHLLMTGNVVGSVSSTMQCLGRRYVRRFNDRHGRTGTLWEGRFRSCLVDTERYLLACYRYIEMNPVRARIVADPLDYRWSSAHANAGDDHDPLLDPHAVYLDLAADEAARKVRYRELLDHAINEDELTAIRAYVKQGGALGSRRFQEQIEALTGRPARLRPLGRPKNSH